MTTPGLILITDHARFEGDAFFVALEAALQGGVDAVLVREKHMDSARLLAFCARLRTLTRQYRARLLVHTQADVALAVEADGVHVAAAEIVQLPALRRWLDRPEMSLSVSCHDPAELTAAAVARADFALLSPVFPTTSHPGAPHLGVLRFRRYAGLSPLPVVGLGGITPDNRRELAGFPVAAISALLAADKPGQAARRMSEGAAC